MSNLKRKLNALTLLDKLKIINEIHKGVLKKNQIAANFGIPPSTLSTIIKNRDKILGKCPFDVSNERKRIKTCTYEDVDEAIFE